MGEVLAKIHSSHPLYSLGRVIGHEGVRVISHEVVLGIVDEWFGVVYNCQMEEKWTKKPTWSSQLLSPLVNTIPTLGMGKKKTHKERKKENQPKLIYSGPFGAK